MHLASRFRVQDFYNARNSGFELDAVGHSDSVRIQRAQNWEKVFENRKTAKASSHSHCESHQLAPPQ